MRSQCHPARILAAVSGRAVSLAIGLVLVTQVPVWPVGAGRVLAQTPSGGQDGRAALAGDACPDGAIGEPPACLSVTGDTRPSQTTVMTASTLAARGREPYPQVLGVMATNPAAETAGSTTAALGAGLAHGSIPLYLPVSSMPALAAAAPQLPSTGTGGLLEGCQSGGTWGFLLPMAGLLVLAFALVSYRRWSRA